MGKSSPKPPDPIKTAAAQTGSNVSTAVANAFLNNVNQTSPYGSLTYDATGNYSWTDPTSNQTYDIPTFTATQSLTPAGQRLQDATMATQQNLADTAKTASGTLQKLMGSQINLSDAPAAGSVPTLQTAIPGAGDITRTYGTDFSADRQRVEDAIMSRAQSGLDSDRKALEQRLADQGITIGSAAYQAAMDDYGRQVNDMRTSAILAGGQEQSRLAGLEADRAAFENSAQAQQFGQNLQGVTFGNDAASRQYGLQQDARNQYLNEGYAHRNQGINEILGLSSGTQVQTPSFVNTAQNLIPTTDVAGLINKNYEQRLSSYNDRAGGILGLFGTLGGAAIPGLF